MSKEILLDPRFRKIVREYPKPTRKQIGTAIDGLQQQFGDPHRHSGLSVRKLVRDYFELRVGLELRLVFKLEKDAATFFFAGTHDEVKRFIKGG